MVTHRATVVCKHWIGTDVLTKSPLTLLSPTLTSEYTELSTSPAAMLLEDTTVSHLHHCDILPPGPSLSSPATYSNLKGATRVILINISQILWSPLLRPLQWLLIAPRAKAKILTGAAGPCMLDMVCTLLPSLPVCLSHLLLCPRLLSSSHTDLLTASKTCQASSTSGPLHLLLLPFGRLFLDSHVAHPILLCLCSNITNHPM